MPASNEGFKLIVGLGNPGREYQNSYHNIGHRFIDYLAKGKNFKKEKKFEYCRLDGLILVKPLTFMNGSGPVVKEAFKYFKINLTNLLIAHDDSDIALGEYKISLGRNSAGHKGVESVIGALKTNQFYRLRIGIRNRGGKAGEFVLKPIKKSDLPLFNKLFSEIKTLNFKV